MIRNCLWPVCLVSLFITGILSLNCNLLNVHLSRVTWQNVRLLNSMSASFPIECLREKKAFHLPQEVLVQTQSVERDIKEAFYEISTQVFNIFSQYIAKSSWEEQYLKEIQSGLDQQLQYLEQCLEEEEGGNEDMKEMEYSKNNYSKVMVPLLNNLKLRKYFNRIGTFLKEKKYSHCAWEIVLAEIRRCFYRFTNSTEFLRRK